MAKLSKADTARHKKACELVDCERPLTLEEREFILSAWQESATHMNGEAGAFFTPLDLAFHLCIEINGCETIIDLCAGIGALAFAASYDERTRRKITCVEINPDYVRVGRRVVPEARWICASVDALPADIGRFDMAIGNPPFGKRAKIVGPRYSGEDDLAVIDIASDIAEYGTFIVPQGSAPFEYSGRQCYKERQSAKYERFHKATGIDLYAGCGVDCDTFKDQWRGVAPSVEIVTVDFTEAPHRKLLPLFEEA